VFVCILPGKAVPEMTYTVSGGMLNPTHSLTSKTWKVQENEIKSWIIVKFTGGL